MKRTVTRWMCMDTRNGRLALGQPVVKLKGDACGAVWANEAVVKVTITYDDGRKSPPRKRRGGGK